MSTIQDVLVQNTLHNEKVLYGLISKNNLWREIARFAPPADQKNLALSCSFFLHHHAQLQQSTTQHKDHNRRAESTLREIWIPR